MVADQVEALGLCLSCPPPGLHQQDGLAPPRPPISASAGVSAPPVAQRGVDTGAYEGAGQYNEQSVHHGAGLGAGSCFRHCSTRGSAGALWNLGPMRVCPTSSNRWGTPMPRLLGTIRGVSP